MVHQGYGKFSRGAHTCTATIPALQNTKREIILLINSYLIRDIEHARGQQRRGGASNSVFSQPNSIAQFQFLKQALITHLEAKRATADGKEQEGEKN